MKLNKLLENELPLQMVGTINAYAAILAKETGFNAIYLSGAGIANAAFGLPDLGVTNLSDVVIEAERITSAVDTPLLVDIDTGWGNALVIHRAVRMLEKAGVSGLQIEDQFDLKRCGHRDGKILTTTQDMCDRIKACVDARTNEISIVARTDAIAPEGIEQALERANAYIEVGADIIFAEAVTSKEEILAFTQQLSKPVLINMTEFGKSPLMDREALKALGVSIILYPLTAWRAMNKAALDAYQSIRKDGGQEKILPELETRDTLYDHLDYVQQERKMQS